MSVKGGMSVWESHNVYAAGRLTSIRVQLVRYDTRAPWDQGPMDVFQPVLNDFTRALEAIRYEALTHLEPLRPLLQLSVYNLEGLLGVTNPTSGKVFTWGTHIRLGLLHGEDLERIFEGNPHPTPTH